MRFRNAFLISVCFGTAITSAAHAASLTALADMRIPVDLSGQGLPKWSAGALVVLQGQTTYRPVIGVVDKSGVQQQTFWVTVPGAQTVVISAYSHGAEGTVAATGEAFDGAKGTDLPPWGRCTRFLMIFPGDGGAAHLIRTGQYGPRGVAVAPDGTVWTSGIEALDKPPAGQRATMSAAFAPYLSASVIRHYDAQGKLLGSFLPQSELATPTDPILEGTFLAANEDRVAWYCAASKRYLELTPQGIVLDVQGIEPPVDRHGLVGFALTKGGRVFVSSTGFGSSDGSSGAEALREFHKATKTWTPVGTDSSFYGIFGADGDTLVTWNGRSVVRFMAVSQ